MDGQMFFQTLMQSKSMTAPIQFNGGDETNSFPVKGSEVTIVGSSGNHELGSSKLHIKNIVNFGWEHRYYPGQLVCHHMSGVYLAYAITTPGKNIGVVRVVNRESDERILIKGMLGVVVDVAFAHVKDEVVLGCVDDLGNLFVWRIIETSSGLATDRVLEVTRDEPIKGEHRLIWCPYLEYTEDEDGDSSARLLVLTHRDQCEMWHIDSVVEAHGHGPMQPQDVTTGYLKIREPGGVISDAAFSPDGSALATASLDGQVKFFQVYMKGEGDPRCLHQWSPHEGKPVSGLFFLDDHSEYQPDAQFWKYAVTGCDHNSELKIWTCESWECLQTIKIQAAPNDPKPVRLKATLDSTARYIMLSDIDRKLVYVLNLEVGTASASVISVSEFTTPSSFLTFCCVSAGKKQVCMGEDGMTVIETTDPVARVDSKEKTVVKLYLVQPKSLQECSIIYEDATRSPLIPLQSLPTLPTIQGLPTSLQNLPPLPVPTVILSPNSKVGPVSCSSPGGTSTTNGLQPAVSSPAAVVAAAAAAVAAVAAVEKRSNTSSEELAEAASKINLMSPKQFQPLSSSLPPPDLVTKIEDDSTEADEDENDDIEDAESQDTEYDEEDDSDPPKLESVRLPGRVLVSGNSSPSREVATILSTDDIRYESMSPDHDSTLRATPSPDFHSTKLGLSVTGSGGGGGAGGGPVSGFPTPPAVNPASLVTVPSAAVVVSTAAPPAANVVPMPPADYIGHSTSHSSQPGGVGMEVLLVDLQKQVVAMQQEAATHQRIDQQLVTARVEAALANQLDAALANHLEVAIAGQMEAVLARSLARLEKNLEKKMEGMVNSATDRLLARCEQVVSREFKRVLPDSLNKTVEPIRKQLEGQIATKLSSTEHHITESVRKMVSNPALHETMSKAVSRSIQPTMVESYKAAFQGQLVGLERAMQAVLSNLNEQFLKGTREYENALRSRLEASEQAQREELAPVLMDLSKSIINQSGTLSVVSNQVTELTGRLERDLPASLCDTLRREIKSSLGQGMLPSPALTPSQNLKLIIQNSVSTGKLDEAFQTALSANDLSLVVFTCELVNTTQIFSQSTCPLSQSVLLSLIQQLSVDLQDKTETKVAFIEEALVNLNPEEQVTKTHLKSVVTTLAASVHNYTLANPNSKVSRSLKTLMMAANGIKV